MNLFFPASDIWDHMEETLTPSAIEAARGYRWMYAHNPRARYLRTGRGTSAWDYIQTRRVTPSFRSSVIERDGGRCHYCFRRPAGRSIVEHMVSKSRGGETSLLNCVHSCEPCNLSKRLRYYEEFIDPDGFTEELRFDVEERIAWRISMVQAVSEQGESLRLLDELTAMERVVFGVRAS